MKGKYVEQTIPLYFYYACFGLSMTFLAMTKMLIFYEMYVAL